MIRSLQPFDTQLVTIAGPRLGKSRQNLIMQVATFGEFKSDHYSFPRRVIAF